MEFSQNRDNISESKRHKKDKSTESTLFEVENIAAFKLFEGKIILDSMEDAKYGAHIIEKISKLEISEHIPYACRKNAAIQFLDENGSALGAPVKVTKLILSSVGSGPNGSPLYMLEKAYNEENKKIPLPRTSLQGKLAAETLERPKTKPSHISNEEKEDKKLFFPLSEKAEQVLKSFFVQEAAKQQEIIEKSGKKGRGWALTILESLKNTDQEEGHRQKLSEKIQLILLSHDVKTAALSEHLIKYFSDIKETTKSYSKYNLLSKHQRNKSLLLSFANYVISKFGALNTDKDTATANKTLTLDQMLARLNSNNRAVVQKALTDIQSVAKASMRQRPKDQEQYLKQTKKIVSALELASSKALTHIEDTRERKTFVEGNSSIALQAKRSKGDYGYEVREAAMKKSKEK